MSLKKVLVLVLVVSILSVTTSAFAAKARTSAPAAAADSVGIVDRGEILNSHPGLAKSGINRNRPPEGERSQGRRRQGDRPAEEGSGSTGQQDGASTGRTETYGTDIQGLRTGCARSCGQEETYACTR